MLITLSRRSRIEQWANRPYFTSNARNGTLLCMCQEDLIGFGAPLPSEIILHLLFGPLANPNPLIWFLGSDTVPHEQIGAWKSEVDGTFKLLI